MNENLRNILREIETAMNEIGQMYERGPIYSSRDGIDDAGNQVVYTRTLSNGINLRLLNDASYSIDGDATEEEKRAFITSLEELIADNSGEVSQDIKNAIYPIIDAVEISIENPERGEQNQTQNEEQEEQEQEKEKQEDNDGKNEDDSDGKKEDETHDKDEDSKDNDESISPELEEYRKKLTEDLNFFKSMVDTVAAVREDSIKNSTDKKDLVFAASTAILIKDLTETIKRIEAALQESIDKQQKVDINYENDLKDALIRVKQEYNHLEANGFKNIDPKNKKAYDELMKQVDKKMKELGISEDGKDNSGKDDSEKDEDTEVGDGNLSIVFDAKSGKYILYDGKKQIHNIDTEEVYDEDENNKIYETMYKRNPKISEDDLNDFVDPAVYKLLFDYDSVHKTNHADEFVRAVIEKDPDLMPVELKYLLSRKNELSRKTYKNVKYFAKYYDKNGLATSEKIKKESREDDSDEKPKRSLWGSIKYLGIALITAVINAGYNIKDVVTGKKKIKELLPPNLFKRLDGPEIKFLPKLDKDKNKSEGKDEKEEKDEDKTKVLPKMVGDKKVSIDFADGQYFLKTGKTFDSPVRYGDIVIRNIDPVTNDVLSGLNLSEEEAKRVDPTVYKALVSLEGIKRYQGIASRYVEAARKGETIPELNIDYDLTNIDAVESKYLAEEQKAQIKALAKDAQSKSRGIVKMPAKSVKPEVARRINEEISRSHSSMNYDKLGYIEAIPTDIYSKMDLDMARRAKRVLKERIERDGVTDQKAEMIKAIHEMAKARGITENPNVKISAGDMLAEIIIHDSDMLSKDASYLMPEEKSKANTHRDSGKGSKGKNADKEEVK